VVRGDKRLCGYEVGVIRKSPFAPILGVLRAVFVFGENRQEPRAYANQ
jgi:hypothetical protein